MFQDRLFYIILSCILYAANCGGEDELETNHNDVLTAKPMKWLKGVQDIFSSPTGHVVVQVAKELINRSAGNSQVRYYKVCIRICLYAN